MGANAWIKTYTFYDSFGIKTFDLSVCVKLIEIAYAKGKIGIGEEFHSLRLLHAHEQGVNVLLDGSFLKKCSKCFGSLFQHLYVSHSLYCLVFFCKLRSVNKLGIAYDYAAWVEVVVECLALTKKLW